MDELPFAVTRRFVMSTCSDQLREVLVQCDISHCPLSDGVSPVREGEGGCPWQLEAQVERLVLVGKSMDKREKEEWYGFALPIQPFSYRFISQFASRAPVFAFDGLRAGRGAVQWLGAWEERA